MTAAAFILGLIAVAAFTGIPAPDNPVMKRVSVACVAIAAIVAVHAFV